jgi:hypothetical protein
VAENGVSGVEAVAGAEKGAEGGADPEVGADFVCVQCPQRGESANIVIVFLCGMVCSREMAGLSAASKWIAFLHRVEPGRNFSLRSLMLWGSTSGLS